VIKLIFYLAIIVGLAICGSTVKLGKRTFFGHVRAIWHSEEVQDLKEGVEDKAGPLIKDGKRVLHRATEDDPEPAGSAKGSAAPHAPAVAPSSP
jgi:hypothetical protein